MPLSQVKQIPKRNVYVHANYTLPTGHSGNCPAFLVSNKAFYSVRRRTGEIVSFPLPTQQERADTNMLLLKTSFTTKFSFRKFRDLQEQENFTLARVTIC